MKCVTVPPSDTHGEPGDERHVRNQVHPRDSRASALRHAPLSVSAPHLAAHRLGLASVGPASHRRQGRRCGILRLRRGLDTPSNCPKPPTLRAAGARSCGRKRSPQVVSQGLGTRGFVSSFASSRSRGRRWLAGDDYPPPAGLGAVLPLLNPESLWIPSHGLKRPLSPPAPSLSRGMAGSVVGGLALALVRRLRPSACGHQAWETP